MATRFDVLTIVVRVSEACNEVATLRQNGGTLETLRAAEIELAKALNMVDTLRPSDLALVSDSAGIIESARRFQPSMFVQTG